MQNTDAQEEHHVTTEAEIRNAPANQGTRRDAKDCQQPLEVKKARKDSSQESSQEAWPCQHPDFGFLLPEL